MNKIKKLSLLILVALFIASCNNSSKKNNSNTEKNSTHEQVKNENSKTFSVKKLNIKTNYFDLTDENASILKKIYNTKDLQTLTNENLPPMQNFILSKVFGNTNPNSITLTGNYFWYVYNALPEFVSEKERHSGYYAGEGKTHSQRDRLLAYSLYRIDRNAENIQQIFNTVKPVLKEIITPEIYSQLNLNIKIPSLIGSYEQIVKVDDYKTKLTQAYSQADTATGKFFDGKFEPFHGAYGFTAFDLSEIISQKLEWDRYHEFYGNPDLSFWMRRNKEGNIETVYKILTEIEALYLGESY